MTFEQRFREWLADKISVAMGERVIVGNSVQFTPRTVKSANHFLYEPLADDINAVAMLVRSATPERPNNPSVDLTTVPLIATLIVATKNAEATIAALSGIADEYNARFVEIADGDTIYTVHTVFLNNEVIDTPYTLHTKSKDAAGYTVSESVVNINWTMRTTYAVNSAFGGHKYEIMINAETYPINGLLSCDFSTTQNPLMSLPVGQSRMQYRQQSVSTVYNFTIAPLKGDGLQAILFSGFPGESTIPLNALFLIIDDGNWIRIGMHAESYREEQGVGLYGLTLTR